MLRSVRRAAPVTAHVWTSCATANLAGWVAPVIPQSASTVVVAAVVSSQRTGHRLHVSVTRAGRAQLAMKVSARTIATVMEHARKSARNPFARAIRDGLVPFVPAANAR